MPLPSIVRSTASRTLHLHLTPRVQNVGESRSILRLLQQFGEVEYFKHLKHDVLSAPQAILCVFRDEATARRVLDNSPLSFRLDMPGDTSAVRSIVTGESEHLFQLRARPARIHLRDQINMSHFHGPFALDTKSAAYEDLVKRVPIVGQSDLHWRAEQKPWKILAREQQEKETRVKLMDLWEDEQKIE